MTNRGSGVFTGTAADYANRSRQGGKDDGPSLLKIGTGEGSQVYGWGLYGSTVRGVAEGHAKRDAWTGKALKTKSGLVKVKAKGSDPSVYVLLYMLDSVAAVACVVIGFIKTRRLTYPPLAWEQLVASH